jgi:ABC-type glutathione transport system ATPase component
MQHSVAAGRAAPALRHDGSAHRARHAAPPRAALAAPVYRARSARVRRVAVCAAAPGGKARTAAAAVLEAPPAPALAQNDAAKRFEAAIPRGETSGAVLIVDQVSISAGDRDLMVDVDLRVMPSQRLGLVGANGCGKSTLLRALCGTRQVDGGRLMLSPEVAVGYLEQVGVGGSNKTVWQEARSRMTHVLDAEAAIDAALIGVEAGTPHAAEALADAQAAFEAAGGYDADKRIANVLTGLGFKQEEQHKLASEFSGGWQMRIGLARTLLSPAGESARGGGGGLLLLVRLLLCGRLGLCSCEPVLTDAIVTVG